MTGITSAKSGLDYSINEQKTGQRWIDGKPIYRKVCPISAPSSWGVVTITDSPSNVSKIVHSDFTLTTAGIERTPYTQDNTSGVSIVFQHADGVGISAWGKCSAGNATGYAIFEYTKTTD